MEVVLMILAFIHANWASLAIAGGAVAGIATAVNQKAYWLAAKLALDVVRAVAVEQLSGPEKRKKAAEEVYKILPLWAKQSLTQLQVEFAVEKAYQFLKGEFKLAEAETKAVEEAKRIADANEVDPTRGNP